MAQLYHWPVPCTICQSPVEYHCNTCGDVLCSKCRDNHLRSNATKNHDVVPYSQRSEPNKPSLQCGDHPGHQCRVWCLTCKKAVCSECVTPHGGHRFLKYDVKTEGRRKEIQDQFEKYSTLLSDWQNCLQDTQKLIETYEKNVKQLDKEISDQADELCKQVRMVEKENRKRLQDMKDASVKVLLNQKRSLADDIQRLEKVVKEIADTLGSTDSSTILKYSVVEENIPRAKPSIDEPLAAPVFAPGSLDIQLLKDLFGSLSEKRVHVPNIKSVPIQSKKIMSLLANPSVESLIDIEVGGYAPVIACVGSGQAWVQTARRRLQLMDGKGKVQGSVNIDFRVYDMTVTPQGNILLTDQSKKCIRSMSMEGEIKILFNTKWEPCGICCLPSGEIVVTFTNDKRVVQYSSTGKIVREFDSSSLQYPKYVAHSQVNQQLIVCDKAEPYSIDAAGKLLSFLMNGKLQFTYTGWDSATFTPVGVCADLAGHVLITDRSNNRVHILDKDGTLLPNRYLDEEHGSPLTRPVSIDENSEGYVWIGEWNTGKVKLVKYLK